MPIGMMQSVAMNESSYCNDDDFVVVEVQGLSPTFASSDPMDGIMNCLDGIDDDDDESYDYCDDGPYGTVSEAAAHHQSATQCALRPTLVEDNEIAGIDSSELAEDATLLDVASSMLQEEAGWETELDSFRCGDDDVNRCMQVSATDLDFAMPASNEELVNWMKDAESEGHINQVIAVTDTTLADDADASSRLEDLTSMDNGKNNDVTPYKLAAKGAPALVGTAGNRPCNKKRRKQLKMAKKAATAAYLAQLALNDPRSATTISHSITRTLHGTNQGHQHVASCLPQSIDQRCRADGVSTSKPSLLVKMG